MAGRLFDKRFGFSRDECIEMIPAELTIDAVGLWQIIAHGRNGFELSGDDMIEFVRRCLLALFAKGAKPVVGASDGIHVWTLVHYGDSPEEMAQAIIDEWLASGEEPSLGGPWFALPHIYQFTRRPGTTFEKPKSN